MILGKTLEYLVGMTGRFFPQICVLLVEHHSTGPNYMQNKAGFVSVK